MVRPESKVRKDPSERDVMRYGEQAGQFKDTSFDIVVTDYVSSVRNVIYIVAVRGRILNDCNHEKSWNFAMSHVF